MEFYNNKKNDSLQFKVNTEGIDINKIETRLIISTLENKNYLLFGNIDKDICTFDIPELSIYEKGNSGVIKFEIISEDLYFPVWEDKFDIKTKATVTFEEVVNQVQESSKPKPKVTASAMLTSKPIKKEEKLNETKEKEEKPIKENKKVEPKKEVKKTEKIETVKNFSSFYKD